MTVSAIHDEDNNPCNSPEAQKQRWRQHFSSLLNRQSNFDSTELEIVIQRPEKHELAHPPTVDELCAALKSLKCGKAAGASNIHPEMLKAACRNPEFRELVLNLLHEVWKEQQVPKEWADATLVPNPKKGNLTSCDNWRGIALLDVVGKVAARIIQLRLQEVAEKELPESQCGFRKGRGCSDMIFVVRQLVEKASEHRSKLFLLFVDLRKAYDSVPRAAMWRALEKLGIPKYIINIIRSFHDGMTARMRVNGELTEEFPVENGLRQGCTLAPTLFNLYACLLVERWSKRVEGEDGVGTYLRYQMDKKLFRRSTRSYGECRLNECQFADDGVLLATTRHGAEKAAQSYIETASAFGLTVSISETKLLATGHNINNNDKSTIDLPQGSIDSVDEFTYLGSVVASDSRIDAELTTRLANASRAFGALRTAVFKNKDLTVTTKRKVYQTCVLSVLLYGAGCWTPLRQHLRRLDGFHHRCIRIVLGITSEQQWKQRITSAATRQQWGDVQPVSLKVVRRRMEWLGHLARMSDDRMPKKVLFGWLPQTRPACGSQEEMERRGPTKSQDTGS